MYTTWKRSNPAYPLAGKKKKKVDNLVSVFLLVLIILPEHKKQTEKLDGICLVFQGEYTGNGNTLGDVENRSLEESLRLRMGWAVSADMENIPQLF